MREDARLPVMTARRLKLSRRERQAAELIGLGHSNKKVATIMGIAKDTLNTYIRIAKEKTGCSTRIELALRFAPATRAGEDGEFLMRDLLLQRAEAVGNLDVIDAKIAVLAKFRRNPSPRQS